MKKYSKNIKKYEYIDNPSEIYATYQSNSTSRHQLLYNYK